MLVAALCERRFHEQAVALFHGRPLCATVVDRRYNAADIVARLFCAGVRTAVFRAGALAGLLLAALTTTPATAAPVEANQAAEVALVSGKTYANPFMDAQIDAVVTQPDGTQLRVPGFWAGGSDWRFRYASNKLGTHTWRTECSDTADAGLHGVTGSITVTASTSTNPLLLHGPIRVAADQRHFEHADGTPFLWLGDTWWKGLCQRMTWDGFQQLTADRQAKGFNVVQIVCGVYPDEATFQTSWENEGGKPYTTTDFSVVNPTYFQNADRRIQCLVNAGMVPAIVGSWGRSDCDAMALVGVAGLERHWRNLVARYGAYPVVWIVAGEIDPGAKGGQGSWGEVATYLRGIDPHHRPVTCHPNSGLGRPSSSGVVIDYDMVGGSHSTPTADATLSWFRNAYAMTPPMPVLCGETGYERHMQQNFQDIQRYVFWMYMLSGAAGHTYGAGGVWHASVTGDPGITPVYDWTIWTVGMNYPGSTQLGLCKKLLEQYPWSRFEPHPEWTSAGFAAGVPNGVRCIYIPNRGIYNWSGITVNNLLPGVPYATFFFDPASGRRFDQGLVTPSGSSWNTPNVPSPQDWVLVMQPPDLGTPVIHPDVTAGQACSGQLPPAGATFAKLSGPAWLTIHADGSLTGTPGESDAGVNTWTVSVTQGSGAPTLIQLQITVISTTGILFAEDFSGYTTGNQSGSQDQSGLKIAYGGNVSKWSKSGFNSVHAVDLSGSGNWAIMFYQDNVITLATGIAANDNGVTYTVNFDYGTAVYAQSSQATAATDSLLVEVLRTDNSVRASNTYTPGTWSHPTNANLSAGKHGTLQYVGDGSGVVKLRIGPAGSSSTGRFQGEIDNISIAVDATASYASWQSTNAATGQAFTQDHDGDGVPNGIEYFLGGSNGNTTGFTALPGVSNTGGARSVTWTKGSGYTGTYGTDFFVETSADLTGTWTAESLGGNVTITGNAVKYIFPSALGSKKFARLKVTGP
ncbi:MAG: DUF4038 domain-containing protein [Verrucomicrobia bacterium]|nr:DUF4038 domain-containing protein [Verrucomicrobiota bacterium]